MSLTIANHPAMTCQALQTTSSYNPPHFVDYPNTAFAALVQTPIRSIDTLLTQLIQLNYSHDECNVPGKMAVRVCSIESWYLEMMDLPPCSLIILTVIV